MATILVTGANRGIGLAFVRQYAAEGDHVHACCRAPDKADELQRIAAASEGRVTCHKLDVTNADDIARVAAALGDQPLDLLINNAGIYGGDRQTAREVDYVAWTEAFAVNTQGPLRMVQALRDNLVSAKHPKVITISSMLGSIADNGGGGLIVYRSTKAAVNQVMKGLSHDLKGDNIIVCPMHPGWVRTDMGGAAAPLSAEESVTGLRHVIAGLTLAQSGQFLQWDGVELAW